MFHSKYIEQSNSGVIINIIINPLRRCGGHRIEFQKKLTQTQLRVTFRPTRQPQSVPGKPRPKDREPS